MSQQNNIIHCIIIAKIKIPIDGTIETAGDLTQLVKELPNPASELRIATEATRVPAQANESSRTQVLLSATA
jgi:hypothetical protein